MTYASRIAPRTAMLILALGSATFAFADDDAHGGFEVTVTNLTSPT